MFCKYCGTSMPDSVKFCPSCGKPSGVQAGSPGGAPKKPGGPMVHTSGVKPYAPAQTGTAGLGMGGKSYNIGNYIFWAGCVMTLVSVFLPYLSASALGIGGSMSLMDSMKLVKQFSPESAGYIMIFIIICVVAAIGLAAANIFRLNLVSVAGSAFFMVFVLCVNKAVSENLSQVSSYTSAANHLLSAFDVNVDVGVKYEIGHTLLLLGSTVMLISSIAAFIICTVRKRTA